MEYLFLSFQFQPVYIFKRSLLQTAYSWAMHFYLFCLSLSTFLLTIKRGGEGPVNSARPTVMLSSVFISCFIRSFVFTHLGLPCPHPSPGLCARLCGCSERPPLLGERALCRGRSGRRAVWVWAFCLGIPGESRTYGVMLDPLLVMVVLPNSFFPSFSLVKYLLFLLLPVCLHFT